MTINPFLLSPKERLDDWKQFRNSIAEMDDNQALEAVAKYFAKAPVGSSQIDIQDSETWPSAWEIVSHGDWSPDSVAIGMEMTLRLAGWDEARLKIVSIRDYDVSAEVTMLVVDGVTALNYVLGEVTPYPKTEQVIQAMWQFQNKKYIDLIASAA